METFFVNFIKKISLLFLIFISSLALDSNANQETIFLYCDYHDVVVKTQFMQITKEVIKLMWNNLDDAAFFKGIMTFCKRTWLGQKLSLIEILNDVPELEKYKKDLYRIATLEKPIDQTISILKTLKEQGNVVLVLASNMDEDFFVYNRIVRPEIFELFDYHYVFSEKNGEKPDQKYYEGMCQAAESQIPHAEQIKRIFVDDKQENIIGAQNANLHIQCIHYTGAEKFEEDLVEYGILKNCAFDIEKNNSHKIT